MIDFICVHIDGIEKMNLERKLYEDQNHPNAFHEKHRVSPLKKSIDAFTDKRDEYPVRMKIQNMAVNLYKHKAIVLNSIHKLHNIRITGSEYNYNDFGYSQILDNLNYLANHLPGFYNGRITRLEFGFNIETGKTAESIISENVFLHLYKAPTVYKHSAGICYKEFCHSNYDIKIYDKAKQYKLDAEKNILRFELRFKSKALKELKISLVKDLYNKITYRKLFKKLRQRFNEIQIIDEFSELSDSTQLLTFTNPKYWKGFNNSQTRSRHVKCFQALLLKKNLLMTKTALEKALFKKYIQLINN